MLNDQALKLRAKNARTCITRCSYSVRLVREALIVLTIAIGVSLGGSISAQDSSSENNQEGGISQDSSASGALKEDPAASAIDTSSDETKTPVVDGKLQFSFSGTAWREVIEWLAKESGLALHIDRLPTGSFTYSDAQRYTPAEAIDRINLFLLPQGFSVIRTDQLLSVIDLGDPRGLEQLETLAQSVNSDELAELNPQQVVKCFFTLEEIEANEAVEELSALNLMMSPSVFQRTNRIMVTDTVAKLRDVKKILDAFQSDSLGPQAVVQQFKLQYIDSEELLEAIRPHLGLARDEMLGIDINLSVDEKRNTLFATGVKEKVQLLDELITSLDTSDHAPEIEDVGAAQLRSHSVQGGDVQLAYDVLQTLLTGKTVRLSMNEAAGTVVALATPDIQEEIAQTVANLAADEPDFAVIRLTYADPYLVVSLLEQMLDLPDPLSSSDEPTDPTAIKIDADPVNGRLFVRAKPDDLKRIEKIVSELDQPDADEEWLSEREGVHSTNPSARNNRQNKSDIRIFPASNSEAVRLLETAARLWQQDHLIIAFPMEQNDFSAREKVLADEDSSNQIRTSRKQQDDGIGRVLAGDIRAQKPEIRCQPTSKGLILQSDDLGALDQLCTILREVARGTSETTTAPVVYYLKYARPDDAIRMLAELLDGSDVLDETSSGSLVNGIVSSDSYFLSSLVTSQNGTTTMAAGTITVVADSRLNRLIAQGTEEDIDRIEAFLKIIDKDSSITSVETYGKTHIIELVHSDAASVAEILNRTYANRILQDDVNGPNNGRGNDPRQRGNQPDNDPRNNNDRDRRDDQNRQGGNRGRNQESADLEPKMTIAVHEDSNSLIITAPDQLYREVEQLVTEIDERNKRVVQVFSVDDANIINSLRSVFGDEAIQTESRGAAILNGGSRSSTQQQPNRVRQPNRSTVPNRQSRQLAPPPRNLTSNQDR